MQTNTIIDVAINQLVPSPRNVRKSKPDKDADQELIAGIREVGLLQNLVVIQNCKPGVYEVVAGTRRLRALKQLVKDGHYQGTDTVTCQFFENAANAEEISLIENTQRLRMHPADEFEACNKMLKSGSGIETIAAALGIPESTVKKRLKLAQVAPEILKAYRNGDIDLEDVMAFTIEDDRARQLEIYSSLKDQNKLTVYYIREALRGETETDKSRLAKFVGEKAYIKAGGTVSHDLFNETVYFIDRDLLVKLAVAKLEKAAAKLEGWNWKEITIDQPNNITMKRLSSTDSPESAKLIAQSEDIYSKLTQLEQANDELEDDGWQKQHGEHYKRLEEQLEQVEQQIENSRSYLPEEKALAGCIVTINWQGKVEVVEGLVRKSDEKALRALQAPPTTTTESSSTRQQSNSCHGENTNDDGPDLSQALLQDLATYRTNIAKRFIANDPAVAEDLLYYTLVMKTFGAHYSTNPLNLHVTETRPDTSLTRPDTGRAVDELQTAGARILAMEWLDIEDDAERFRAFTALNPGDKAQMMAYCVAQCLECDLTHRAHDSELEVALTTLDIPWHKYFTPTVDNYLGRVSKATLLELGEQFFTDWKAEGAEQRTKKQLAQELEEVFAGYDENMSAAKRAEAIDWIPAGFKPL